MKNDAVIVFRIPQPLKSLYQRRVEDMTEDLTRHVLSTVFGEDSRYWPLEYRGVEPTGTSPIQPVQEALAEQVVEMEMPEIITDRDTAERVSVDELIKRVKYGTKID